MTGFSWKWPGGKSFGAWWRDDELRRLEHAEGHALLPVDPEQAPILPVYAFIDTDVRVHCQFKCLCGNQLALHRTGDARSDVVTYFETCQECKRRWSLRVAPTLPTFDMTLTLVKG